MSAVWRWASGTAAQYATVAEPQNESREPCQKLHGPHHVAALRAQRHLRGDRVFCQEDGGSFTHGIVEAAIRFARKHADLRHVGCHVLRHSFCSQFAMRGAAPKAIQELAGTRRSR